MDDYRQISPYVKTDFALHQRIAELAITDCTNTNSGHLALFKSEALRVLKCPLGVSDDGCFSKTALSNHFLRVSTQRGNHFLVIIAPPIGGERIYYSLNDNTVYLAQRARTLVDLQERPKILESGLKEQLYTRLNTPGETLYQSVNYVPPGMLLAISLHEPLKPELVKYFDTFKDLPSLRNIRPDRNALNRLEQHSRELEHSIIDHWKQHHSPNQTATVLLSGGYDSALLLALAKKYFENVIAVSAGWDRWPNPELVIARKIAAHLNVEHRIVDIDEDELIYNFQTQIESHEKVIRNLSSLVMPSLLKECEKLSGLVIYGEGADILFGSADTFTIARKVIKSRKLAGIPGFARKLAYKVASALPDNGFTEKLILLLDLNEDDVIQKLNYIGAYKFLQPYLAEPELDSVFLKRIKETESIEGVLKLAQFRSLQYNIADHLFDIHECSNGLKLCIDAPFLGNKVMSLACCLRSDDQLQKNKYKPVIRQLVNSYYPESIFPEKKMGFTVPSKPWVNLLMKSESNNNRDDQIQKIQILEALKYDTKNNHEVIWNYLCLRELINFTIQKTPFT